MIRIVTRDASCTLIRFLNYTVISAMSISIKVTLNLISAVLRHDMMILLTLEESHNIEFLRVEINIVILLI